VQASTATSIRPTGKRATHVRTFVAVIATIPDDAVKRDVLGPVLRGVILAAASTGLRQSELLGLRWRDVDTRARRVRCATRGCAASTPARESRI
jgi:integrase